MQWLFFGLPLLGIVVAYGLTYIFFYRTRSEKIAEADERLAEMARDLVSESVTTPDRSESGVEEPSLLEDEDFVLVDAVSMPTVTDAQREDKHTDKEKPFSYNDWLALTFELSGIDVESIRSVSSKISSNFLAIESIDDQGLVSELSGVYYREKPLVRRFNKITRDMKLQAELESKIKNFAGRPPKRWLRRSYSDNAEPARLLVGSLLGIENAYGRVKFGSKSTIVIKDKDGNNVRFGRSDFQTQNTYRQHILKRRRMIEKEAERYSPKKAIQ